MSSIDEIIARSRQPGTFTERRTFTVARGRAIQKMREFALVDPHYYILELIQSAVSNGATFIDIQCDRTTTSLSYTGGSFHEAELAQLFDFLFASKDDVEHGPLRLLALGVNALMNFEPDEIVIETGDGTHKGTTRIEIRGADDVVEVGRPEAALNGTYLRATGLSRRKAARRSSLISIDGHPPEYNAVESRCLVAPVPILFNHDPLFGYSRQRTPQSMWGLRNELSFDEGDLYGAIGISQRRTGAVFRLVTQGVWIESARRGIPLSGGSVANDIGGVISFDRLRKTADHSSIVQDEIYEEMWLRLRPYVNRLKGQSGDETGFDVANLDGEALEPREIMEILRGNSRVVMVSKGRLGGDDVRAWDGDRVDLTRRIGESLRAPVLAVRRSDLSVLRNLAGVNVEIVQPRLDHEGSVKFYLSEPAGIPPHPWLISPEEVGKATLLDVAGALPLPSGARAPEVEEDEKGNPASKKELEDILKAAFLLGEQGQLKEGLLNWKARRLDPRGESLTARLYSPEESEVMADGTNVEVRAVDRTVWSGTHDGITPGQLLIVNISDVAPSALKRRLGDDGPTVAEVLSGALVEKCIGRLQAAGGRALRAALRSEVEPGTQAAALVLGSLSQRLVKRIRPEGASPRIRFAIVDPGLESEVLDLPVLRTLDGSGVSIRRLEEFFEHGQGLIYGVREDVEADLEGLDRGWILKLSGAEEQLLVSLVGPSAYVRVDRRDMLAAFEGVYCRDIAVGLRDSPDFPLLVEGPDVESGALMSWPDEKKARCVQELVAQLMRRIDEGAGLDHESVAHLEVASTDWDVEEHRRQAWRHLQRFALSRRKFDWLEEDHYIDRYPLFLLSDGRMASLNALRSCLQRGEKLLMVDGWSQSGVGVGLGEGAVLDAVDEGTMELPMNAYVLFAFGDAVTGSAGEILSVEEARELDEEGTGDLLEELRFDDEVMQGVVGVPVEPVEDPAVIVFGADKKSVHVRRDLGRAFGVVGKARLKPGVSFDDAEGHLSKAAQDVLGHLLARVPRMDRDGDDAEIYERSLEVLLGYAGGQLTWEALSDHQVVMDLHTPLARRILNAPLFPTSRGVPVTAMSLCRAFQRQAAVALAMEHVEVELQVEGLADFPMALKRWIGQNLTLRKVQRPSCYRERRPTAPTSEGQDPVTATLSYWLQKLRPDTDGREVSEDEGALIELASGEVFRDGLEGEFCQLVVTGDRWSEESGRGSNRERLWVNGDHWLAKWLSREGSVSAKPIAWAVLAAYAHINNVREPVTNDHELLFQQRVLKAMEDGELQMVQPSQG